MRRPSLKSVSLKESNDPRFNFSVFRDAWNLLLFSAVFAVLFNLSYSNGIELKVIPPKSLHLQEILKSPRSQPLYTGWNTPPSPRTRISSAPAPSDSLPRLSLLGAKDRFDRKAAIF